jgi:hypothetical protein
VQPENEQVRTSMIAHADQKIPREYEIIVSLKAVRNKKCSCRIQYIEVTGEKFRPVCTDTIILYKKN